MNAVCACALRWLNSGAFWTSEVGVTSKSVSKKNNELCIYVFYIIKLWAVYFSDMTAPWVILLFAVSTVAEKDS